MNSNSLFVSSKEAQFICDKNQYGEASFIETLKLNIRWVYCKVTRTYVKRNTRLTKAIKKSNIRETTESNVKVIQLSKKEYMKEQLRKELSK